MEKKTNLLKKDIDSKEKITGKTGDSVNNTKEEALENLNKF
jgi:hypothetical protein